MKIAQFCDIQLLQGFKYIINTIICVFTFKLYRDYSFFLCFRWKLLRSKVCRVHCVNYQFHDLLSWCMCVGTNKSLCNIYSIVYSILSIYIYMYTDWVCMQTFLMYAQYCMHTIRTFNCKLFGTVLVISVTRIDSTTSWFNWMRSEFIF